MYWMYRSNTHTESRDVRQKINKPFGSGSGPDQHLSHLGKSLLATIDHCSGPVLEVLIDLLQRLQVILGQFHLSPGEPLNG